MPEKFHNIGDYVRKLDEVLRQAHRIARNNLKGALRNRKKDYDVELNSATYEVGDCVYKINSATGKGFSKKLLPIYDGPFLVTKVLSPALIEIEGKK